MKQLALAILLAAAPAFAQSVVATSRGVVVAHDGMVELIDREKTVWRSEGVPAPGAIVTDEQRVAILDPLGNEVRFFDLRSGHAQSWKTGQTPLDGVFIGSDFYVLARDSRSLERFGTAGPRGSLSLDGDPAFLGHTNGMIYVYSRLSGTLTEITPEPFAIARVARLAPFASAMEVDRTNGYLVFPRSARIAIVSLATMKPAGQTAVGAVPVGLAFAKGSSALSARTLAVADPAAKKVWLVEGAQSTTEAFTRGFIRGLLGLGLYSNRTSQFPTGVDRVWARGSRFIAYDSASRTLYRFSKTNSTVLANDIGPRSFTMTAGSVAVWQAGRLGFF